MLIPNVPAQHRAFLPEGRMSGPMPWVIAVLMFVTLLMAASGFVLRNTAVGIGDQIAGRATIQIVDADRVTRTRATDKAKQEAARITGVQSVRIVPQAELAAMLDQWFGDSDGGDGALSRTVPIPALLDVVFTPGTDADAAMRDLRAAMRGVAPSVKVIAHSDWLAPVARLIRTLTWIALALVGLMTMAAMAIVMIAARGALAGHMATIDVLHLIGATDQQITRLFQRRIAIDTAWGVAVGAVSALAVILTLRWQMTGIEAGLTGGATIGWLGWIVLVLIPLAGVAVAALTARWALLRTLEKIL